MLGYLAAIISAVFNAASSVAQRKAGTSIGDLDVRGWRLAILRFRNPYWLVSVAGVAASFCFHLVALAHASLTVVQPLLVIELVFALALAQRINEERHNRGSWAAAGMIVIGLAGFLATSENHSAPSRLPSLIQWIAASGSVCLLVGIVRAGLRSPEGRIASAGYGIAAGALFALTAAFAKYLTVVAHHRGWGVLGSWSPYVMAFCGIAALWLSNNAFQYGQVRIAQPAITITDPLVSVALGVGLFGESLRSGVLVIPELVSLSLVVCGVLYINGSNRQAGKSSNRGEAGFSA